MAFGQQTGPPASAKQVDEIAPLLEQAGYASFREARHIFGLTQRQASGKFTQDEADRAASSGCERVEIGRRAEPRDPRDPGRSGGRGRRADRSGRSTGRAAGRHPGRGAGRRARAPRLDVHAPGLMAARYGAAVRGRGERHDRQHDADGPWTGDASSLVDAFRAGERSPVEELEATLAAIEASDLNCFSPRRRRAGPGGGRARPTSRCRSVACRPRSRSSSRWPAGRGPRRRSCIRDRVATHTSHHVAAAARAGRGGAGRADHGQRVRRPQRQRHQDQRRHPQPLAARPHRRRIVERLGRGGERRAGEPGHAAATAAARSASRPATPGCSA